MNASQTQTPRRPAISAAVICLNEEENIARCLDCLSWCDQIVVVDSGSTDNTLDIVAQYQNTKIFIRPFDTYINQKNYALEQCDHDWVLSLDADEVLPPPLIKEIANLAYDRAGYYIGRRTFLGDQEIKHGSWSPDYKLRLFRKSAGRWGGTNPHEKLILQGLAQRLKTRMLHFSYDSRREFVERNRKYTRIMVEFLTQSGREASLGEAVFHWIGNFVKCYLLRLGFLDGSAGLFLAYHIANASFMKYYLLSRCRRENISEATTETMQDRVGADDAGKGPVPESGMRAFGLRPHFLSGVSTRFPSDTRWK